MSFTRLASNSFSSNESIRNSSVVLSTLTVSVFSGSTSSITLALSMLDSLLPTSATTGAVLFSLGNTDSTASLSLSLLPTFLFSLGSATFTSVPASTAACCSSSTSKLSKASGPPFLTSKKFNNSLINSTLGSNPFLGASGLTSRSSAVALRHLFSTAMLI